MKTLNLFVLSRYQEVLDGFFESILPTIDDKVHIYTITEGLKVPEDPRIFPINRTEFNPIKYFNIAKGMIKDEDKGSIGIINDDIRFSSEWLQDVRKHLEQNNVVSPGFIETKDYNLFENVVRVTKNTDKKVYKGLFDAFFIVNYPLYDSLDLKDETTASWYDIYITLELYKNHAFPITSQKITVMHFGRTSFPKEEKDLQRIKESIMEKYGYTGLVVAKYNSLNIRKEFNYGTI
jgi:hypothetical protein